MPETATAGDGAAARRAPQPNDVIICCAVRTPITKARKGGLAGLYPDELLKPLYEAVVSRTGIDPAKIEDISIGNCLHPGAALSTRVAQLLAGVPDTCAFRTTNRLCAAGLQAVVDIAAEIHAGYMDIGLAGGVETMTHFDMGPVLNSDKMGQEVHKPSQANDCLISMGMTSENVAEKFGVSRLMQDQFAVESHAKAAAAQKNGLFDEEIIPITVNGKTISMDDGIRPDTNMEVLAKLKPAFKPNGTTTAGNSSQISDGAALCLVARRSIAEELGLPILARFVSFSANGVAPNVNGIGPIVAIPAALQKAGLTMDDIDIFDINEAFASQAAYCGEFLKIPKHKLNPKGGAIALGHPLGATGARQIATLLPELKRTGGRYGVVSMGVGGGMGAAGVIESLQ